ncbi:MAG: glycoside hydrolase family 2 protein [Bacteroidota bacterium]
MRWKFVGGNVVVFILFICQLGIAAHNSKSTILLNDKWEFRQAGTEAWSKATVPGSVQLSMLNNEAIENPFYGTNELKDDWISQENWEYRTTFDVNADVFGKDELELVFEGLDTYAKVYLNGNLILEADNYFRKWRVNVRDWVALGRNALQIFFYSPEKKVQQAWNDLGYELPGGMRTMTRKPQFHYGWDWGPRMVTMGISGDITLEAWDRAKIASVFYHQVQIDENEAQLSAEVEITSTKIQKVNLVVSFGDIEEVRKIKLRKGINRFSVPMTIPNPKLWWSRGLGDQHMYQARTKILFKEETLDSDFKRIGLRTIELVTEPDDKGTGFYFKVNGIPVFMKGANYIPMDIMQGRVGAEQYARIIKDATDANMNMIRVWGGGIYEKKTFYDLCDENGILVWQDFMFACAMYPGDSDYLSNVKKEAIDNIRRLRNHPSIALWCGNNEVSEGWHRWGWQDAFNNAQKNKVWKAYQKIFREILPDAVKEHHPGMGYWESSPKYGRGNPQHQFEGDSHYWGVWHDAEPFSMFEKKVPRFMSEFGFQSFPEMKTIMAFAEEDDLSLDSKVMDTHQKHPRGNSLIREYMERDFNIPNDFADFVYVSQILQAEGMRIGLEAHRRSQPYCMGTLYWQLNDCWPVASWSSVDYYGNWKALHYAVKKVFAEFMISPVMEEDKLNIYVISERMETKKVVLNLKLRDVRGKVYGEHKTAVSIPPNQSTLILDIPREGLFNPDIPLSLQFIEVLLEPIEVQNQVSLGEESYASATWFPKTPRETQLLDPDLSINIKKMSGGYRIDIGAKTLARFVQLETDIEGTFSNNYFDIMPGEKNMVFFKTAQAVDNFKNQLKVRTLFDVK